MSYKLSYTGSSIDEILKKASSFEANNETWVVIDGIETLPMAKLLKPGNYIFNGNILLPEMSSLYESKYQMETSIPRSALIFVRQVNQNVHQFISFVSINLKSIENIMIAWIKDSNYQYSPYLYHHGDYSSNLFRILENEISDPYKVKFDSQLRVFTDDKSLKYYDRSTNEYKDNFTNIMSPGIYGKINDVFTTADSIIATAIHNIIFNSHLDDSSIHISSEDKATLTEKFYNDEVDILINNGKDNLKDKINSLCNILNNKLSEYIESITNINNTFNEHTANSIDHPNTNQIIKWNDKSNSDHIHTINDIQIDTDHIVGEYPINILKNAMQRHHTVSSKDELLALTSDTVQLHDWVFLDDSVYPTLYQIIDDTKLGSLDAFKKLVTDDFSNDELIWENIKNKPTTLDDLGAEYPSNESIDDTLSTFQELVDATTEDIQSIESNLELVSQKSYSIYMETMIDIIDNKMKAMNELLG